MFLSRRSAAHSSLQGVTAPRPLSAGFTANSALNRFSSSAVSNVGAGRSSRHDGVRVCVPCAASFATAGRCSACGLPLDVLPPCVPGIITPPARPPRSCAGSPCPRPTNFARVSQNSKPVTAVIRSTSPTLDRPSGRNRLRSEQTRHSNVVNAPNQARPALQRHDVKSVWSLTAVRPTLDAPTRMALRQRPAEVTLIAVQGPRISCCPRPGRLHVHPSGTTNRFAH